MDIHKIDRKQLDQYGVGNYCVSLTFTRIYVYTSSIQSPLTGFKEMRVAAFKCTKCNSSYRQKRSLDQHLKYECGVAFQCTLCTQNFTVKGSLRAHLLSVHNIAHRKLEEYGAGIQ